MSDQITDQTTKPTIIDPKNDPKPNRWDFLRTDTVYSAMRLAFMRIVTVCLICLPVTIIAYFLADWFGHHIDISPIIMLIASVLVPAVGGKAVQSFSENRSSNGGSSSSFNIGGQANNPPIMPYMTSQSSFGTPLINPSILPTPQVTNAVLNAGNGNATPVNIGR